MQDRKKERKKNRKSNTQKSYYIQYCFSFVRLHFAEGACVFGLVGTVWGPKTFRYANRLEDNAKMKRKFRNINGAFAEFNLYLYTRHARVVLNPCSECKCGYCRRTQSAKKK